jgi:hypothetical protein
LPSVKVSERATALASPPAPEPSPSPPRAFTRAVAASVWLEAVALASAEPPAPPALDPVRRPGPQFRLRRRLAGSASAAAGVAEPAARSFSAVACASPPAPAVAAVAPVGLLGRAVASAPPARRPAVATARSGVVLDVRDSRSRGRPRPPPGLPGGACGLRRHQAGDCDGRAACRRRGAGTARPEGGR